MEEKHNVSIDEQPNASLPCLLHRRRGFVRGTPATQHQCTGNV